MKISLGYFGRAITMSAFLLFAWGCKNPEGVGKIIAPSGENPGSEDGQAAQVRDYILSLGIPPEKIVSEDDKFIVDGDLAFDKKTDYARRDVQTPLAKGQQYMSASLVSMRNARNIRVRLTSDLSHFSADLDGALRVLNNTFSGFYFQRTSQTNQDILIRKYAGTDSPGWAAMASWPNAGKPGPKIDVNTQSGWVSNSPLAQRTLVHELLHCLGFFHNKEISGAAPAGGTLVPNTPPYNNEDPYGIMHVADRIYEGRDMGVDNSMSYFDHLSVQYMYPYQHSQRSGDVNGDGKTDIILIKAADNGVSFKLSDGSGLGSTVTAGYFGDQTGQYLTGDVNGDGKSDFLFANYGTITIRYSNGNGFNASQTLVTGFGSGAFGRGQYKTLDFNGDGKSDIMYLNFASKTIQIRFSNGTSLASTSISAAFGDIAGQYFVGDFNGDGKEDVMCANRPTNLASSPASVGPHTVSIIYSNGATFGAQSQLICGDCFGHISWGGMYLSGDYNNDGKDDIYFKDVNGHIHVALSTGSTLGTVITSYNAGAPASTFFSGDFTGDGRTDILSANRTGGIGLLRSNGNSPGAISSVISSGFGNQSSGDLFL